MGEAKRRTDRYADGLPCRPPRVCPKCKSIRVERACLPPTALSHRPTDYDVCRECKTIWEAYPDNWSEDLVGAEPCDNCAFRPGSPEQQDPEKWNALVDQLRMGQAFHCHKGSPILGLIAGKTMSKAKADGETAAMEAVLETLRRVKGAGA